MAEDSTQQFSPDVEAGAVIAVLDGAGAPVPATYPERGAITLVVSVGPVPPVEGLAVGEAESRLKTAGLVVEYAEAQFDNEVPIDVVITADWLDDPMNPGDIVRLTVSKGPDLVEVPNLAQRANKMMMHLLQKYVYRLRNLTPPSTLRGEQAILIIYGLLALAYRIFLFITITLYVMGKLFAIGLVLAVWTAAAWFIIPIGKFIHWHATSDRHGLSGIHAPCDDWSQLFGLDHHDIVIACIGIRGH